MQNSSLTPENQQEIINKTAEMVKQKFMGEGSGHDWWHIYRVWNTAKTIAAGEEAGADKSDKQSVNLLIVELAALLHDIADYKFHDGDETIGGKVSQEWLESIGVESDIIERVVYIVDNVSFKGGGDAKKMGSLEGKIVQDADRLDSMGAMGIARCFAYGGFKNQEIYNPEIAPRLGMSKEEYKSHRGTQINHFYEKLLLLKDLMNTQTARQLAQQRHQFMQSYLEEFFAEWEGKR
jgi:uncharacterized protein